MVERERLNQLRQKLQKHFNLSELKTLLFELGIDHQELSYTNQVELTREIVAFFVRQETVPKLMQACIRARPSANWGLPWRYPNSVPYLGCIGAGRVYIRPPEEWKYAEDWIDIPSSLHYRIDELFALRAQGNSMIDAGVLDGDFVIVRYQPIVENGELAAMWIEKYEISTLKRFYFNIEEKSVELKPYILGKEGKSKEEANSIIISEGEVVVFGKVVWVVRETK
ncbi:MAG: hypothetical protein DWQ04_33465 [Chloroflexi bacterium]|nr:MAG: hypothetical protein DWQ04_33465 [Chloroflexota bacterium]